VRIKLNYITPLLAAGAAAAAIASAPIAPAAPARAEKSCTGTGGSGTVCQSRGNVEINNAPPPVRYYPYGDFPYLLGGLHGGLR
jgi:hypothetical protein